MTRRLLLIGLLMEATWALLLLPPLALWRHPTPSLDLHIVTLVGAGWRGLAWYLFMWSLLVVLHLAALLAARGEPGRWTLVLVYLFTVLFSLTLIAIYPATSADIFHYIMDARIRWLYGENPLTTPPSAYPDDPFAAYASWPDTPAPYGPIWLLLSWLPHTAGGGRLIPTLIAFKVLVSLFSLATAILVFLTARQVWPRSALPATLLYAWSPLVLFNTSGDGHNDAVMLALVLLGLYFLVRDSPVLSLVFLMGAIAVKAVALLLLPLAVHWLWRSERPHRRREALLGLGLGAILVWAAYLPFWAGLQSFASVRGEAGFFTASLATVFYRLLQFWLAPGTAEVITNLAGRGLYLLIYAFLLWRVSPKPEARLGATKGQPGLPIHKEREGTRLEPAHRLLYTGFWAVFLYLAIGAFWFMPWYALWPLALAATAADRQVVVPALVLSATAMLSHAVFGFGAATLGLSATSTRVEAFAAFVIWSAPLLSAAVTVWHREQHPRRRIFAAMGR